MIADTKKDLLILMASRISTRMGDGFLRILSVLLVAEKTHDPMIAGLVLVFRYLCETLINAVSGPFIDRIHIKVSLMASDLIRAVLSALLVASVLLGYSYKVYLVLAFLGDFTFLFFKPAVDKVVKVSFPVREGTKIISEIDAVNHCSNIAGFTLASFVGVWLGLSVAVCLAPLFFVLSFFLISFMRLRGEKIIDYEKVRKKGYWASQKEGMRYTLKNPPMRLLLFARTAVAVGRGAFAVLSVVYLADVVKGLSAYGYFESAQSAGKVLVTALVIPFVFAYRSSFLLMGLATTTIGLSFFGFSLANDVVLACVVGAMVGVGQASEAVAIDSVINRYSEAHIQARTKSTTSFGSRVAGLGAIAACYYLIMVLHVSPRTLFIWMGIFPLTGAAIAFMGWSKEKSTYTSVESAEELG